MPLASNPCFLFKHFSFSGQFPFAVTPLRVCHGIPPRCILAWGSLPVCKKRAEKSTTPNHIRRHDGPSTRTYKSSSSVFCPVPVLPTYSQDPIRVPDTSGLPSRPIGPRHCPCHSTRIPLPRHYQDIRSQSEYTSVSVLVSRSGGWQSRLAQSTKGRWSSKRAPSVK